MKIDDESEPIGGFVTMDVKLKAFHKELEKTADEKLPLWISKRILELVPILPGQTTKEYLFINQVYTEGEFASVLTLYDKKYDSPLHEYGVKEELLLSYQPVKPGLLKEHRIRNAKGRYEQTSETIAPQNINAKKTNVMLIKRTEWDSFKEPKTVESYTIFVFNRNNFVLEARNQELKDAIKQAQEYSVERKG